MGDLELRGGLVATLLPPRVDPPVEVTEDEFDLIVDVPGLLVVVESVVLPKTCGAV